jgi:molecular chaperone GrpE
MAHDDSDDKVHLASEGLSADSHEPGAVEAANENASLRDRLLRALAEVENTRRRAERRVADAREYGISDFAAELLSVVDSLQRAVASAEDRNNQTPADAALLEGVRATQRQLLATLARFGVKRIEALGASLDPNLHEAMAEVEDDSSPPTSCFEERRRSGPTRRRRLCRSAHGSRAAGTCQGVLSGRGPTEHR